MIECRDMRVDYDGFTAVHDLCFDVGEGEVFGLIGPNGAGKTSTIRVLATLQQPTYGEVRVAGIDLDVESARAHKVIGYMPDMAPVDDDLKCWEFLELYAGAYGLPRSERRRRVDECLELVDMTEKRDAKGGTLSRGMKQRLVLAKTLLMDPEVMLLDEPASGLDPVGRVEMREILKELSAQKKTVLVSSHILTELSEFCTSYGFMEKGRMVQQGRLADIAQRLELRTKYALRVLDSIDRAVEVLGAMPAVSEIDSDGRIITFGVGDDEREAASVLGQLTGQGVEVIEFVKRDVGVENVLMSLSGRNGQ